MLEELHWSAGATLDWLASVARRRAAVRRLVLGSYHPVRRRCTPTRCVPSRRNSSYTATREPRSQEIPRQYPEKHQGFFMFYPPTGTTFFRSNGEGDSEHLRVFIA